MTDFLQRRNLMKQSVRATLFTSTFFLTTLGNAAKIPRTHGRVTKKIVSLKTGLRKGTILISNNENTMDFVLSQDHVARYVVASGRDGFVWTGEVKVAYKREWPTWRPPAEMRIRDSSLPELVPPGPHNPLGARAIYLFKNGKDTLYRIHGTNDAESVGGFETSGCFRMTNADILEFYNHVSIGSKVIVRD